jgi:hypothetical protein
MKARKKPEPNKIFRLNDNDLSFFKLEELPNNCGTQPLIHLQEVGWLPLPDENRTVTRFWNDLEKYGFIYAEKEFKENRGD